MERLLDEEVLNAAVLAAAQEHDIGVVDTATGAADLLVVGDDRPWRLVVDDERQVLTCRTPYPARLVAT